MAQAATLHGARLVEYLHDLAAEPLPADLAAYVRRALLDTVGCCVYGADQPWTRILAETASQDGGSASVLGRGTKRRPATAALINGTAAHGFELDDFIVGSFTHAGAPVISAALATAEDVDAPGWRLLSGILAGYELMGRVGRAMGKARSDRGLHYTGQLGAVGAAIAAGTIRGLGLDALHSTVGIAASMGGGIKAFTQGTGGMVKRLHAGRAAEAGAFAAELSARGFTGPKDGLDGAFGMIPAIGGEDADPSRLTLGLGDVFMIHSNWTKLYPCCAALHAACQGIEDLRAENGLALADIARVTLGGSERMATQNGGRVIEDTMAAQYSGPFSGALSLLGSAMDPSGYEPGRVNDPQFRGAMDRIDMVFDPEADAAYPDAFAARITLRLTDGRDVERFIEHPKGTAQAGVSDADIEAKFRHLTGAILQPDAVEDAVAAVREIERADGVGPLCAALSRRRPQGATMAAE
ncbi:MAG: MmgE/PrpD family protein [Alphaproteobacteria bacterium]